MTEEHVSVLIVGGGIVGLSASLKTKELLEARWKMITFAVLALLVSARNVAFYPLHQSSVDGRVAFPLQSLMQEPLTTPFNAFVWESWFVTNGSFLLCIFAALLGGGLITSEVSKGTLYFLLSKPVSRERIQLTKYGVSAVLLLAVSVMSSIALAVMGIVMGHPQDVLRLLVATGLLWLAALFPLGLSLFFSVMSPDSLRPVVFSLLITVAVALLPSFLPHGLDWSLRHYWSSLDAYLVGSFPLKEYLVCLVAAVVPLLTALVVFHRKAY
jgi:ABC-type transport system involved in multi-copper enzyme maturation permease subunit